MSRFVSVESFSMQLVQLIDSNFICVFVAVIRVSDEVEKASTALREFVEQTLKRSGYQNIKLSNIFHQPNRMALNYQQISEF